MMAPAAFLLMLAAACTDDNGPSALSDSTADNTAISFRPQAADTRAVVENDFPYGAAFSVWGWYQRTDGTIGQPFNATTVTNNGGWTYQGTQYWVDDATYDFYAIYPASVANAGVESDGTIRVTGFDCSARGENAIDLMTAEAEDVAGSTHSTVGLNFRHELARVQVVVRTDPGVTASNVQSTFSGFYTNGTLTRTASNAAVWDALQNTGTYNETAQQVAAGSEYNLYGDMLLIPQSTNGVELTVSLMQGSTPMNGTFDISNAGTRWQAGRTYRYTIHVEVDAITFSDFTVDEWGETMTGGDINIGE